MRGSATISGKVPDSATAYRSATVSGYAARYSLANPLPPPRPEESSSEDEQTLNTFLTRECCLSLGPHSRVMLGR
ncbi:hypothetical protein DPMN_141136 [Dreissena polymorpha]|uniref:Uncharacterized protein n=1 Tax=Dreissena polymorpha TaxID=45954 RepID=A0A9D4GC75_DREPO|nr:hypothetical protein DPMN_141136 [Dreissena polymorpha]